MRGKVAKRLRREVYGETSHRNRDYDFALVPGKRLVWIGKFCLGLVKCMRRIIHADNNWKLYQHLKKIHHGLA